MSEKMHNLIIRKYNTEDCREIARLFFDTVHGVNCADYTKDQLDAWADGNVDLDGWNQSFLEHNTVVAVMDERIVGFGDMDETGYLDRLYVHRDYLRRGIAGAICGRLEGDSKAEHFYLHASVTAKPFFEKCGYRVVREQHVERKGVRMKNYLMEKQSDGL